MVQEHILMMYYNLFNWSFMVEYCHRIFFSFSFFFYFLLFPSFFLSFFYYLNNSDHSFFLLWIRAIYVSPNGKSPEMFLLLSLHSRATIAGRSKY